VADVRLTIGAFIEGLKKGLEEAKGYIASFAGFVKKHEGDIKKVRLESGIAFAAEILAVRNVVKAYGESEQANIKLAQAMKARGVYTEELFTQTVASADAMMRLTTFDDEVIKGAQTMLIALANLTGNGLERATKATLDLAQAKELDLSTAATMVARAINGDTDSIGRYIKVSTDGMNESQRFEAVLAALAKTFGGQAEAATAGTGALKQLSNMYGELKESLGSALMPILSQLAKWLSDILPKMQKWVESNKTLVAVLAGGGVAGTGLILLCAQFALAFSNPVTGIIAVIGLAAIGLAALVIHFRNLQKVQSDLPTTLEGTNKQISEFTKKLAEAREKLATVGPGGDSGMLAVKRQWESDIKAYEEYLQTLYALRKKQTDIFNADILAKATPEAGADGVATPTIGGGGKGDEPAWLTELMFRAEMEAQAGEELFEMHKEMDEKEWERAEFARDRFLSIEQEKLEKQKQMAEWFLATYVSVFENAFARIEFSSKMFGRSLALAMLESFIGLLQMAIDGSMKRLLAKYVETVGEITLESLMNPFALAKLGVAAAAYGAAKAALGGIVASARASMTASIPKYEYGGVVPETGLALVHKGEHIWNPQHPGAGGANSFTFNHYGDLNSESAAKRAMREFEEALISGNMRRRLA
jgi:hypothetical protein